jgi:hypothetical protein
MLGVWLLLTTIPYYTLSTYNWAIGLGLISDKARITNMGIQAISSAFFNSNHCINILIYVFFHGIFRAKFFELLAACFNLNPFVKMNPYYFASLDDKARLAKSSSFRRSLKRSSSEEMDSFNESVIIRNMPTTRGKVNDKKMAKPDSLVKSAPIADCETYADDEAGKPCLLRLSSSRLTRQNSMYEEFNQISNLANRHDNKLFLFNEKSFMFKYYKRVENEVLNQKEASYTNDNETIFLDYSERK